MAPTYLPGERSRRCGAGVRFERVTWWSCATARRRTMAVEAMRRTSRSTPDLRGDNAAASTDSRDFGLVDARDVAYIVLPQTSA